MTWWVGLYRPLVDAIYREDSDGVWREAGRVGAAPIGRYVHSPLSLRASRGEPGLAEFEQRMRFEIMSEFVDE